MEDTVRRARIQRRCFDVFEYYRMAEAGILHEDDRVELIEGEIVEMTPIGPRHANCVDRLTRLIVEFAGRRYVVRVQGPIRLDDGSEPQPDLTLLRRPAEGSYASDHPTPQDVLLVVEVADASLEYDREVKLPLYARAGIPEAWLMDLRNGVVEVHSEATPEGYRTIEKVRRAETVSSKTVPGLVLRAEEILG